MAAQPATALCCPAVAQRQMRDLRPPRGITLTYAVIHVMQYLSLTSARRVLLIDWNCVVCLHFDKKDDRQGAIALCHVEAKVIRLLFEWPNKLQN
jgi:hypothetical protein